MRILTLSWEYPPHVVGGMGKHVTELVAGLASRGFECHVVTPQLRGGRRQELTRSGVHVWRVAAPPVEDYSYV